jgi:hypothetical protein
MIGTRILCTDLTDLEGDLPLPLGQHLRCGHAAVVSQRNRIMGRVSHDHVGRRDGGHHPLACRFPLQLANAPLDLGVALEFLAFLPEFLASHLEFVVMLPDLEWHIDHNDQQHRGNNREEAESEQVAGARQTDGKRLRKHRQQVATLTPQNPRRNAAKQ